jgi:tetratricopeptide (TPR) repeat protein
MKLFNRKPKTDPALARYPAALAALLELGGTDEEIDYASLAEQLREYTPDLIRLVLDEDFADREEDDPAAWAPFHALEVLAILGPAEAAEPLLACLEWETDWGGSELVRAYAGIGPVAAPLLLAYLEDGTHDPLQRALAADALRAIVEAHPATREQIVDALTRFLDRPEAGASADEELTTAFVISDLTDLKATEAYDAIARAFAEDRVDTQILDLKFVEQEWGMRPRPDGDGMFPRRTEPGVRLVLKCKACERERAHVFPKVYCDIPTLRNENKLAKYDPLIIPQRVICPKCGAVDQYELSPMAQMAIMAGVLSSANPELELLRPDQQIQFITFTTRWGEMHPVEADERYQQELARQPDNADLQVGYANLKRFLGYADEARERYHLALTLDSNKAEAWINLAQMASAERDLENAIRYWEMTLHSARRGGAPSGQGDDYYMTAEGALLMLRNGIFPEDLREDLGAKFIADTPAPAAGQRPVTAKRQEEGRPAPEHREKIGRNDPCPCGSGKKYKHCHGRK